MSGGGEVRVLRQEAGQESPRMPAWKREILERRKAKGGGSGAGAAEPCPSATSSRVNGEVTGNSSASKKDNGINANSGRNYTITPASQHFAGKRGSSPTSPDLSPVKTNKESWTATDTYDSEKTVRDEEGHESLVLQDSLGPLQENPFIKLEKERKKRQDRESNTRPVQHILELYGSVPGIRTIRAENIIIIESDPDYFPEASGIKSASYLQQNGVSSYSSLNDLLDRRGSGVTEIRAKEVVIYDTALSRSEENLSTLGRPSHEGAFETGEGQGRVSRMLQKFDSNYGKLQHKSRSTENLLDLEASSSRPRQRPKPQPDLVPKYKSCVQPSSPVRTLSNTQSSVFQSFQSSKTKPQTPLYEPDGTQCSDGAPQSVSSYRQRFEVGGGSSVVVSPREAAEGAQTKPIRERDWDCTEVPPKPKVPCSPDTRSVSVESPPSSNIPPLSPSPGFEIRPSPLPDLSLLPAGDVQACALANLRIQSRNSFTVIPKRHETISSPGSTAPSSPIKSPPSQKVAEMPTPSGRVPTPVTPPPTPAASRRKEEDEDEEGEARLTQPEPPPPTGTPNPSCPSPVPSVQSPPLDEAPADLPVTNIDDVDVDPSQLVAPSPTPVLQRRKGNTFTVVPKRKSEPQPDSPEPQEPSIRAQTPSTPSQAPYAQLGSLLKKRYPAAEEIEVIGGYQSLGRSCLTKMGSTGRKLKISFNESSLHSTYEYPSESSAWDSGEEEDDVEEGKGERVEQDQPSMVGRIHIPRPHYTSSSNHTSNSTDLSNYVPKHTVDFNTWQEHKLDNPNQGDTNSQCTQMSEEVMLTPADTSSLTDFSSEPALYF
ncbi:hypothetical protein UPYG_G00281400 [Umbra pygmaea]|uniref:Taperin n=1 Tax=Umbra pygmaea TaxID=75934 RepID=A0ABD0W393_UMBPY